MIDADDDFTNRMSNKVDEDTYIWMLFFVIFAHKIKLTLGKLHWFAYAFNKEQGINQIIHIIYYIYRMREGKLIVEKKYEHKNLYEHYYGSMGENQTTNSQIEINM